MKPILGITMGDPSGNGPEISVKALMDPKIYDKCRPVIVGDAECLREAVKVVEGAGVLTVHPIRNVKDAVFSFGTIDVLDMGVVDLSRRYYRKGRHAGGRKGGSLIPGKRQNVRRSGIPVCEEGDRAGDGR